MIDRQADSQATIPAKIMKATAMKRKIIFASLALLLLVVLLAGVKGLQISRMMTGKAAFAPPPEAVTTAVAGQDSWEIAIPATGSLEAAQGVTIAAELPGKVTSLAFASGAMVKQGDLLIRQNTASEEAQLKVAEAEAELARLNFARLSELIAASAVSRAAYEEGEARHRQAAAQVQTIKAAIAKKTIAAPFSGRLGIRLVNLGQILKEGEAIVSLQALEPILVNFLLPQQEMNRVKTSLPVRVTSDALPGQSLIGKITAINPQAEASTRNVRVQASLRNPGEKLKPGMFATVAVILPGKNAVLAIPATAVLNAPYGDSVFVLEEGKEGKDGQKGLAVRQQFVRLGERRGDFIAVVSGLKPGDTVVSSGVFKLRNGQGVVVNNSLKPGYRLDPKPENS